MNNLSFADLMVGLLAYVSLTGLAAIAEPATDRKSSARDERWPLPGKGLRRRGREDACRHCTGSGQCDACQPSTCRVCRGSGLQPRDVSLVPRLTDLWNGR